MSARQLPYISPEEYLAADRAAEFRSEYIDGQVFAMSGGSRNHSFLIAGIARELGNLLQDRPCNVSVTELRLQVAPEGAYLYPDVMVVCEDDQTGVRDMITNPTLVVEVLSPSTERWDRVRKFEQYRRLKDLREYLLVSQDEMRIEWYTRDDNGKWFYRQASGPDGICSLEQLGVEIPLAAVYHKIQLS
jgi:Uma2 family endonuclease